MVVVGVGMTTTGTTSSGSSVGIGVAVAATTGVSVGTSVGSSVGSSTGVGVSVGSMVGSYLGGAVSGRMGTMRVQLLSLALSGAGFLWLVQLRSVTAMALGVFAVGAISDAYRPACLAAVVEAAPPELRTRALGLVRLAANAGMAIGPAAGGLLAAVDYRWIFVAVVLGASNSGRSLMAMSGSEGSMSRSTARSRRMSSRMRSVSRSIPDMVSRYAVVRVD